MKTVYLIGSLRSKLVPEIGNALRAAGFAVFDDWHGAGPEADDCWQAYEQARGRTFAEALNGYAARNTFEFDKRHLDRCDLAVLVLPAGKSGHLELGYFIGQGKPGYILGDKEPDRWDVMYQFAAGVFFDTGDLIRELKA